MSQQVTSDPMPPKSIPIDFRTREIRILILMPGRFDDPITCSLQKANLDENPQYDALSYVWGDPEVCRIIYVDGCAKNVTVNLFAALRRLRARNHTEPKQLWVDALCIEQENNDEKSHQVAMMANIYKKSRVAFLWLGDYAKDLYLNEGTMAGSGVWAPRKKITRAFHLIRRLADDEHFPQQGTTLDGGPGLSQSHVAALTGLMEFSWWSRVWTVQEAILPNRAFLLFGAHHLKLLTLDLALMNRRKHQYDDGCCNGARSESEFDALVHQHVKVNAIIAMKQILSDGGSADPSFPLAAFRDRQSSDARDQIYGVLGLLPMASAAGIVPDYSLHPRSVFSDTVAKLISYTRRLGPLWRPREYDRDSHLPSWVTDWTAAVNCNTNIPEINRHATSRSFDSCSGRTASFARYNPIHGRLCLAGIMFDTVVKISNVVEYAELVSGNGGYKMMEIWKDCITDGVLKKRYPSPAAILTSCHGNSETYESAIWSVFCMDTICPRDFTLRRLRRLAPREWKVVSEMCHLGNYDTVGLYALVNRRFFVTETGLIGTGPVDTKEGDAVHILWGGRIPYILRPVPNKAGTFQYIGDSYVHGIMDGEAAPEGVKEEIITLV
ncbi:heterokaryon incompatibility protein-domain-containing protein [Cladorrhinum sp. PSN332]|nr:heterokaryon incompatibility protein-domain-containing protein [Cladorrhinum sp. PSN332]